MKHVQLFEQFVNEKVYRLTGIYAAKGIVGALMQAFKKEIERISHEGDPEATLAEVNKAWAKWAPKDGAKIIIDRVLKAVRNEEEIAYITASLNTEWQLRTDLGGDGTGDVMRFSFPSDFVINVGFMDDANGSRYSRKLDGMMNSPLFNSSTDIEIMGAFDPEVGQNNIEIRSGETMMIDAK
jgi:hypothetical protein